MIEFEVGQVLETGHVCLWCRQPLRLRVDAVTSSGRPDGFYLDPGGSSMCSPEQRGETGCSVVQQWKAEGLWESVTVARANHDLFCTCQASLPHTPDRLARP